MKDKHLDAPLHVRGESLYVDDVAPPVGMLHAAIATSPVAHGRLLSVDTADAEAMAGVVAAVRANDVPGDNEIGPVIQDEPLLAESLVDFMGQPVVLIVAESAAIARAAAKTVVIEVEELEPVTDPRVAFERGSVIGTPRVFASGDVEAAWDACDIVVSGRSDVGGQEHLYLETQRARALPGEEGRMVIFSSTQSPYAVQRAAAGILGVPAHLVEVDVKRLGGGFGGKEDQATAWGCLAALAAHVVGRPVELVLDRVDDLRMTGKRHPYSADWKLGARRDGTLVAWDVRHYQNSGASCDLSLAVLERTLFHAANAYRIPNVRAFGAACRTNLPPNTAFRGFGGPQGMFAIECAIAKLAETLGMSREDLQRKNLIAEGDTLHYGQVTERCNAQRTWDECATRNEFSALRAEAERFNRANTDKKRGLAMMPVCFGIAFTGTFLNQASALVHAYTDGSVSVSTGGVEMGQGLTTKLAAIAARHFGISPGRVRVETTNTTRIANMSPTAASAGTDLNGGATMLAIDRIKAGLFDFLARELGVDPGSLTLDGDVVYADGADTGWDWPKLVSAAYMNRIALSAHAFYATPGLHFDKTKEHGNPFAYHVFGTAILGVTVDGLRGTYEIDTARIVHDLGRPVNELVDLGQIEGALGQGLGWMTMEDLRYDPDTGRLLSNALSTYKAPDLFATPRDLQVTLLDAENPVGPFGSKAVGEPPLMYGIGVYFALRDAVRGFVSDRELRFDAPMTPERVLMDLYADDSGVLDSGRRAAE